MNPVEIGTGKSFKGLAAYLLHDPERSATAERVAWAESFNLDGADPDRAWRLMAATAMSADQLKAAAGIKKGRAAKNTAYHFSLNFNPQDEPSAETQRAAVESALKALGLETYQALAVAHRDTAHTHVHVMVNLINPENGLSAASKQPDGGPALMSNTQRKLSQWAQKFEREHGLNVTEGRLANANKRAQGEKVDARRDPRNVYERKKTETTERRLDYKRRDFAERAHELANDSRALSERFSTHWEALKSSYRNQKDGMRLAHGAEFPRLLAELKEQQKPQWGSLYTRHRRELKDFEQGEKSVLGRIWHGAAVFREKAKDQDALGGFLAAFSQEARRGIVMRKHDRERIRLSQTTQQEIAMAIDRLKKEQARKVEAARLAYLAECKKLKAVQDQERAAMRARWNAHNAERKQALSAVRTRGPSVERGRGQDRGRGLGLGMQPD